MALTDSTLQTVTNVENFRCFIHWMLKYQATDKERCLLEAMTYRQRLISSDFLTADYLDGIQEGIVHGIDAA